MVTAAVVVAAVVVVVLGRDYISIWQPNLVMSKCLPCGTSFSSMNTVGAKESLREAGAWHVWQS